MTAPRFTMDLDPAALDAACRASYDFNPAWDAGENLDGFQVTPAGPIPYDKLHECGGMHSHLADAIRGHTQAAIIAYLQHLK